MGSIHPLAQQRIFDPDTAHAMGLAFETAWQKLLGSRSELRSPLTLIGREKSSLCILSTWQMAASATSRIYEIRLLPL